MMIKSKVCKDCGQLRETIITYNPENNRFISSQECNCFKIESLEGSWRLIKPSILQRIIMYFKPFYEQTTFYVTDSNNDKWKSTTEDKTWQKID